MCLFVFGLVLRDLVYSIVLSFEILRFAQNDKFLRSFVVLWTSQDDKYINRLA